MHSGSIVAEGLQGIYTDGTLGALALKPSGFCIIGAYPFGLRPSSA